jgi:hypothetical protein
MQPEEPMPPLRPAHHAESVPEQAQSEGQSQIVQPVEDYVRVSPTYNRAQVAYLVLAIVEILLTIRLVLKLLDANPDAGFSLLLYGITSIFVFPFQGVFPSIQTDGSIFELSTLLAMVIYALLTWVIVRVILVSRRRRHMPTM